MDEKPDLSIVIPTKDEQQSVSELSRWIIRVMKAEQQTYEVIYIDDGSKDNTWREIVKISRDNPAFKGIRFNINYGKAAALQTGFDFSSGRVIITMDADLQDSPEEIPELYNMIVQEGYDLVSGWKKRRKDPFSKTIPSKLFNFVTRKMSGVKLHDFNCGIKAYRHSVVKSINLYGEMHRYIPVLAKWAGFTRIGEKPVKHFGRKYGTTKFGNERFIRGFLDLLSIMFMSKFQRKPMHFFGSMGILSLSLGFIFTIKLFYQKIESLFMVNKTIERDIPDQPIFYIALAAITIGVQLFLTGYLAEMITLQSISKRNYLITDKTGIPDTKTPQTLPQQTKNI